MERTDVQRRQQGLPARSRPTPRRTRRPDPYVDYLDETLLSLRDALRAAKQGDFSVRLLTDGADGPIGEVLLSFNALAEQNAALVTELGRVERAVGAEGRTTERASLGPVTGGWALAVESLNSLVEKTAWPITQARSTLGFVAEGDLTREMPLYIDGEPLQGDFRELGATVNTVVARLRTLSSGVSRVVREMGTEGRLGVQASMEGLSGTWKDLVDDVNLLAESLTGQVRNIALVSAAIANGDLSQKITVETRGEILELKNAINSTVDQLRAFAAEGDPGGPRSGNRGKLGAQGRRARRLRCLAGAHL